MRLPTVNCILLACLAVATANEPRPKRDLLYLKNLLTSKIFGSSDTSSDSTPLLIRQDGDARIFRIPGFDDILVKAIPKANIEKIETQEEIKVIEHPTIAILKSYLGTKTEGETLIALQGIKNLLKSGILDAQRDLFEIVPVKEPCLPKPAYIPEPPIATVIPVLAPTIVPVIPVSPIDTKYSYKKMHLDGHMTTYTSKDGHDVIVSETNGPIPTPPSYISDRIQQVIVLGMKPVQAITSVIPKPVFHVPKPIAVPVPIPTILQAPRGDVKVNSYSYKQHHHDGGVSTYSGSGQNSVVEQQGFLQPPIVYKVEKVGVSAPVQLSTNLPIIPSGYRFRIMSNANSSDDLARRLFYNSPRFYQSPDQTTRYVYKQINENTPSVVYVGDRPRFDTEGQVHVNVNSGHSNEYNQLPYLSTKINPATGEFFYKQHHNDGSITTYSGNGIGSSMVKETVKMPALHIHNVDRIENEANAHEAPLAKPLLGYSFKTVNDKAYINMINNPETDRKESNFQMGTQGTTGSGGYSYKLVSNDGSSLTNMATGVRPEESLATLPNFAAKPSSGYSFKIVNNQAFASGNGGEGQSSLGEASFNLDGKNISSKDGSSSYGAYSYKLISNDGTSATYTAPGVKLEESSAAQDNSAGKGSPGYSFKIVNGNTADQVKANIGMTSFNAASNNVGSSMVEDHETFHIHNDDRIENAANAHEAPLAKLLSGYSFKTVNGKAYMNMANNPETSTDRKESNFQMETQGTTGSGGYSYEQVSNDGSSLTNMATGVRPEESLATLPNFAAKPSSGYSFKIVNNQAFASGNGGKGQSSLGEASFNLDGKNISSKDRSPSSGAYSYKLISNDGTSATYTAPGVKLEESSAAQDNSAGKGSPGYSFKIVNGNTADQVKANIGMTSFNAASNNVGSSMVEDHETFHIHNDDRIENAANAHEAPLAKLLSGYSFKTVNGKAYMNMANNQATTTEQKENNSEMGTPGISGSEGYSYNYMSSGGIKASLAAQANSAEKPPSGYSFKIRNNQAYVGNNGGKGQSSIGTGGAYSYTQISNDDTSTTHFASEDGEAGKPAGFVAETDRGMPTLPAFIVNRIEKVASQAHAADKASSEYSFKIVNGNSADLTQQYAGMTSLNAASHADYAGSDTYSYKQEKTLIPYGATVEGDDVKSDVLMEETIRPIPAYVIDRIENVAAQGHVADKGLSGYSFKIGNGQAFVSSTNGQAESNIRKDLINHAIGENLDESLSSLGSGAYSYKLVNSAGSSTSYLTTDDGDNSAVLIEETNKPISAPLKYIVNTIENVPVQVHAAETGPFKIVNNQASNFDGNNQNTEMETNTGISSSPGSYTYSQVNNFKSLNSNVATNPTTGDKNDESTSGYSFKLVNNQAFSSNAGGQTKPSSGMGSLNIAGNANEGNQHAGSSGSYSYKQIGNAGTKTVFGADQEKTGNAANLISEINTVALHMDSADSGAAAPIGAAVAAQTKSGYSFSIVNNVHGSNANGDSEWNGDKHQALMFTEPLPSTYSYKQINTNNPQPFTVVRVKDGPTIETNSDLSFKVNTHEHINSDGTRYLCDERHLYGPELAENVYAENVSEVQNGYMYVPPTITEDMTEKKEEIDNTQDDHYLSKNPIVVAPLDHVYSFKQTKTDGSLYNVESNRANTVSVSVNEGDIIEGHRGDIP